LQPFSFRRMPPVAYPLSVTLSVISKARAGGNARLETGIPIDLSREKLGRLSAGDGRSFA
jgi:hypothetical protein